jgi:hypothetical protein
LRRAYNDVEMLAVELLRPKYQHLIGLIVGSKSQQAEVDLILRSSSELSILQEALESHLGEVPQRVINVQCEGVLTAASEDLPSLTLQFNRDKENAPLLYWPTIVGHKQWSRYETLLVELVASNLHIPAIRNKVLLLMDATEDILRCRIEEEALNAHTKSKAIWSEIVRVYGLLSQPLMAIPISAICISLRYRLMFPAHTQLDPDFRDALLVRVERSQSSYFAMFLLIQSGTYDYDHNRDHDVDFLIKMLLLGWNSRLPILRHEALHMIESQAHFVQIQGSVVYRREVAENVGFGFDLPKSANVPNGRIVPKSNNEDSL